jgi:hypothetical protein
MDLIKVWFGSRVCVVNKDGPLYFSAELPHERNWKIGDAAWELTHNHLEYVDTHFKEFAEACFAGDLRHKIKPTLWLCSDIKEYKMGKDVLNATKTIWNKTPPMPATPRKEPSKPRRPSASVRGGVRKTPVSKFCKVMKQRHPKTLKAFN